MCIDIYSAPYSLHTFPILLFLRGPPKFGRPYTRRFPTRTSAFHYTLPWSHHLTKAASQLSVYLSAILSLLMATMLGFIDDLFDIRWRHKLPIPLIASIPLLLVYYAEGGNTHIVVPKPFRSIFGTIMDLGAFRVLALSCGP